MDKQGKPDSCGVTHPARSTFLDVLRRAVGHSCLEAGKILCTGGRYPLPDGLLSLFRFSRDQNWDLYIQQKLCRKMVPLNFLRALTYPHSSASLLPNPLSRLREGLYNAMQMMKILKEDTEDHPAKSHKIPNSQAIIIFSPAACTLQPFSQSSR